MVAPSPPTSHLTGNNNKYIGSVQKLMIYDYYNYEIRCYSSFFFFRYHAYSNSNWKIHSQLRVILEVPLVSLLYPSKNDVTLKITI
jgi:hypothetical protein